MNSFLVHQLHLSQIVCETAAYSFILAATALMGEKEEEFLWFLLVDLIQNIDSVYGSTEYW